MRSDRAGSSDTPNWGALGFLLSIGVMAWAIALYTPYGGIIVSALGALALAISRTALNFVIGALSVLLGVAFDSFLRLGAPFYFYRGDPERCLVLCSTWCIVVVSLLALERLAATRGPMVDFKFSTISTGWRVVLNATVLCGTVFVVVSGDFVTANSFDNQSIGRYPFLEYVALVIIFLLASATGESRIHRHVQLGNCIGFALVCIASSYRMVGFLCILAIFAALVNGLRLKRIRLIFGMTVGYVVLTLISYWRLGEFDVSPAMMAGYQNGRLDNTFTGVIETALIYTQVRGLASEGALISQFLGAIAPLPNSLLPPSWQYIDFAQRYYVFPGGGLIAGFVLYFDFVLLPIVLLYVYLGFRFRGTRYGALLYVVALISVPRWTLYGPYVLFKFLGVAVVLALVTGLRVKSRPKGTGIDRQPIAWIRNV